MANEYYTLLASLPHLQRFDQAERLPINLERLRGRLNMLDRDDRHYVQRMASLIAWQRQPAERTAEKMIAEYEQLKLMSEDPVVNAMVDLRMDVRTVIAALRRRHRGKPAPKKGERWGAGRWVLHIVEHWDDPYFKLANVYPWLPQARGHLENGEALALERLLFNITWNTLDRLKRDNYFTFDVVLAYLFKWDMMQRWLEYDVDGARQRFDELMAEALDGKDNLFD